jgi:hypothetical protein
MGRCITDADYCVYVSLIFISAGQVVEELVNGRGGRVQVLDEVLLAQFHFAYLAEVSILVAIAFPFDRLTMALADEFADYHFCFI